MQKDLAEKYGYTYDTATATLIPNHHYEAREAALRDSVNLVNNDHDYDYDENTYTIPLMHTVPQEEEK